MTVTHSRQVHLTSAVQVYVQEAGVLYTERKGGGAWERQREKEATRDRERERGGGRGNKYSKQVCGRERD